jgi:hypothetical protein
MDRMREVQREWAKVDGERIRDQVFERERERKRERESWERGEIEFRDKHA